MELEHPTDRHVGPRARAREPHPVVNFGQLEVPEPIEVTISDGSAARPARLAVPPDVLAVAVFVHGGGAGGRTSIRDGYVADRMRRHGLATLLVDLLTRDEAAALSSLAEAETLAERVGRVVEFVAAHPSTVGRPVALVGSGTGSPAALRAAATDVRGVSSVVCCGGPIELAGGAVAGVDVPVLVLVAERDVDGVARAAAVLASVRCEHRLDTVVGERIDDVTALDQVATSATAWILRHLPGS